MFLWVAYENDDIKQLPVCVEENLNELCEKIDISFHAIRRAHSRTGKYIDKTYEIEKVKVSDKGLKSQKGLLFCECCGKEFKPRVNKQRFCSRECQLEVYEDSGFREMVLIRHEANRRVKKSRKKLAMVNKKAREMGLSYGQYVALYENGGEQNK